MVLDSTSNHSKYNLFDDEINECCNVQFMLESSEKMKESFWSKAIFSISGKGKRFRTRQDKKEGCKKIQNVNRSL